MGNIDLEAVRTIKHLIEDTTQEPAGPLAAEVWSALQPFIGHLIREGIAESKRSNEIIAARYSQASPPNQRTMIGGGVRDDESG